MSFRNVSTVLTGFVLLVAGFLVFTGCESDSGEEAIRNVGLQVSGLYRNPNNGPVVSQNSGDTISQIDLRQTGDQLEGITDAGTVFRGTIGQATETRATFNMTGQSSSGAEATMSGNIDVEGAVGTMQGSWIEPTLFATVFGVATVPTNAPPPTNAVLALSPSLATVTPGETQQFTATGGDGTFQFAIANNSVGSLTVVNGATATYQASAAGQNTITVTSNGESASATINQNGGGTVGTQITISPEQVTRSVGSPATFSVANAPDGYSVSLSNTSIGSITEQNGGTLTYSPSAEGQNTITVTGSSGSDSSTILQTASGTGGGGVTTMTINPSFVSLSSATGTTTFVVSGGTSPYDPSLSNSSIGRFRSIQGNGSQISYEATAAGNNTLTVESSDGQTVSASINQF